MVNEDNDKPVYGPTDDPEAYRDLSSDNVPQDPNADNYPESDELPESYLEEDEARNSVADAERKSKLGAGAGDLQSGLASAAKKQLVAKNPEAAKVQETVEKAEEAAKFSKNIASDFKNFASAAKPAIAALSNPYVWIGILAALVVTALIISVLAVGQVFGQTKSSQEGGGAAGAMQQRLAQRAEWLQNNYQEYGETSGPLYDLAPSPKSKLSANPWPAACTNIVPFIYGLSPYLINYNGNVNAQKNWANHPEMYEAYAFNDGRSSGGAGLGQPPAGAIVSINYPGGAYGHSFVMLTDELVIDNWSGGGIVFGTLGGGPRIISDTMRGQITGWALPKSEGFEGTFITGTFEGAAEGAPAQAPMPDLPPVPAWAGGGEGVPGGDSGGGTYNGPAERANWMRSAGIAESDWTYVDYIAMKESSWNPKATNAQSGACGLIQALPCSKVPGDGYNPVDNLRWADGYAKSRYGSWKAAYQFWQANHWW